MDLPSVWFILVAFLLTGYAVLDGFDLGVGILHLTVKEDKDRRSLLNAIGPVWDGNEVWLVTGGGALFAAFPNVYATVFSGFYLAFMLFLFALIFRAVALEFRNKVEAASWRTAWDWAFSAGSTLAALLLGVAFGNIIKGLPLASDFEYTGSFVDLLNPFALFVGVVSIAILSVHGSLYLSLKTSGGLRKRMLSVARLGGVLIPLFVTAVVVSGVLQVDRLRDAWQDRPGLFLLPFLSCLAGLSIPFLLGKGRILLAFLASSVSIMTVLAFFFSSLYPVMVDSPTAPENSLTILNASSSPTTLKVMLVIACIALPLILFYTVWVYRVFKGPLKISSQGY